MLPFSNNVFWGPELCHKNRGKCCPNFSQKVVLAIRISELCHKHRGKCCPFFPSSFFFFGGGGVNAAQFIQEYFLGHLIFGIFCHFYNKRGENAAQFFPRSSFGPIRFQNFVIITGGNAAHFFQEYVLANRVSKFCHEKRGIVAQNVSFLWGAIGFFKFQCQERRICWPMF